MNLPKEAVSFSSVYAQPEITHLIVIILVPLVQFLAGMYVKQVGYFHISSSSANIVKKWHKGDCPYCVTSVKMLRYYI